MKLGTYPALKLADARQKALTSRLAIEADGDPANDRIKSRQFGTSVDDLAAEYWKAATLGLHGGRGRPKRNTTIDLEKQRYERHAAPVIGTHPFAKLTKGDLRTLERDLIGRELSPHTVAGVLGAVRAILGLAVYEERLVVNPAAGVIRTASLGGRERLWSADEARAIYQDFSRPSSGLEPSMGALQRLIALTLVRRDEARLASWAEIDRPSKLWTIPGHRMKNGRPHLVPLTDEALAVLDIASVQSKGKGLIFQSLQPEKDGAEPRPFNKDAPYVALRRVCKRLKIPAGGPHDWRRTGATLLTGEVLGTRRFVVSLLLSHSAREGAAVTGLYDRNEYITDKRNALQAWARFLTKIPSENVVRFKQANDG